jgi:hypothetical protein
MCILFFLLFICAYKAWFISPPCSSLTTHSTPSLSSPPPQYPAETILPEGLFFVLFFETRSHDVTWAGLELMILLLPSAGITRVHHHIQLVPWFDYL